MYRVLNSLSISIYHDSRINIYWDMGLQKHMTLKGIKLLKLPNSLRTHENHCCEQEIQTIIHIYHFSKSYITNVRESIDEFYCVSLSSNFFRFTRCLSSGTN